MTDKDKQEAIRKFLDAMPDTFGIMKEGIDMQTQLKYLQYSDSFGYGELSEAETLRLGGILFNNAVATDLRKKALILLAHLGSITAYRQIEKYYNQAGKETKAWAAMALQECRMFLESELLEESTGFIATGLGGDKDKLRFFFLFLSIDDQPFTATQISIIRNEFCDVAKAMNCEVEAIDPAEAVVGLTVLVPMDVAVDTFADTGIKKCNGLGDFVFEHYYVTNAEIPKPSEIPGIIRKIKG